MSLRTDRVRAVGIFKHREGLSREDAKTHGPRIIEMVQAIPIAQQNLLKYEITVKAERLPTTLASDLGLKETGFSTLIIAEAASHEKLREVLTSPEYKKIIQGALDNATTIDDYHYFSGEFVTVIDK
ncbi:hypothetical protein K438DRAFT_1843356 [Mycena galopus ATCC 62051]|nr:hypothetical protein K438DRAFT_1843356 [Mycena galopus ATCC 62051]